MLKRAQKRLAPPKRATFHDDVIAGLSRCPKQLSPKYFYDARGCELFEQICELEEYYPTRAELELMHDHAAEMAERLGPGCMLIEPGAGAAVKTRILLEQLEQPAAYVPIEIAGDHLRDVTRGLSQRFPELNIAPVVADFAVGDWGRIPTVAHQRRVVYFPGSTLGNFEPVAAGALLRTMRDAVGGGGALLIGIDLQKDTRILEAAYDDSQGVTAEFNLNLLDRINRELGGDFDRRLFFHRAFYNTTHHRIEMHLVSRSAQQVGIAGKSFNFDEGESICTEYSHKYNVADFRATVGRQGLDYVAHWTDRQQRFAVVLLGA